MDCAMMARMEGVSCVGCSNPNCNASKSGNVPTSIQAIERNVGMIKSGSAVSRLTGLLWLRQVTTEASGPSTFDELFTTGVVSRVAELLASADSSLRVQHESSKILRNCASGTAAHAQAVVDTGCVPALVALLSSPDEDVQRECSAALAHLGRYDAARTAVLAANAMPAIIHHLVNGSGSNALLRSFAMALERLAKVMDNDGLQHVRGVVPVAVQLLESKDTELLTSGLGALGNFTGYGSGNAGRIQLVLDSGALPKLIDLLAHSCEAVQTAAVSALADITSGTDPQTQECIDAGLVTKVVSMDLLSCKHMRFDVLRSLSHMTAGTSSQVQTVFDAGLIPPVVDLTAHEEFAVAKQALFVISRLTEAEDVRVLVKCGVVSTMVRCACGGLEHQDTEVLVEALAVIGSIAGFGVTNSCCVCDPVNGFTWGEVAGGSPTVLGR
eukprot:SAG22_NODE_562_length_9069_cov_9.730212_3_plen_441_part_00